MSSPETRPVTTLILVRHAEKVTDTGSDPTLTPAGRERADELAYLLKHVKLDAVYSTSYRRTTQTAMPTAKKQGLEIRRYKRGDKGFSRRMLSKYPGGTVLIVGHSTTIPPLANALIGRKVYHNLKENIYDNLFIVTVPATGRAKITRIRFGAHTPEESK